MCGIAGVVGSPNPQAVRNMITQIKHRGPDNQGYFDDKYLSLGHARLSILDLSESGHQPMTINKYTIVYNGEVYNLDFLKSKLPNIAFTSTTDTEIILQLFIYYGPDCFSMLSGMFALAIYENNTQKVWIARDKMGIKPLYYTINKQILSFCSEVQGLSTSPKSNLSDYLSHGYYLNNESFYENVYKLPKASWALFENGQLSIVPYWTPSYNSSGKPDDFESVMLHNIKQTMIADVPVGVYLSSGIDSTITTYFAHQINPNITAYTIGFTDKSFDESENAKKIADIIGVKQKIKYVSEEEFAKDFDTILDSFGEPFADISMIPTYYLNQLAAQDVKVVLSGDGADELFAGYPTYYLPQYVSFFNKLPLKSFINSLIHKLPSSSKKMSLDYKLKRFSSGAQFDWLTAHSHWRKVAINKHHRSFNYKLKPQHSQLQNLLQLDQETFMEGQFLPKMDRLSMQFSIEVRTPYLNNEIIHFANNLKDTDKLRGRYTKAVLRDFVNKNISPEISQLPKMGFSAPLAQWFRNSLKNKVVDSIHSLPFKKLQLNEKHCKKLLSDHMQGKANNERELLALVSLSRYL